MKLLKRISLYLAFILPALGLLISRLRNQEFNSDEFQHTYLAWANLNYDQMPYRDLWDNHGSLYTFSNSLLMKLANLKAGVDTILVERYFNLFIFVLGALVLFELFRLLTNKIHYAALGTWLFALTNFATYTIQVRPDNLQCLFLYLGLLLITKAIKKNQNQYAFLAGISFVLMLMTNAKSISALCGVIIALVLIKIIDKQSTSLSILWSVIQGLALALLAFAIFFASQGMLENYLIYSILYNKDLVLHDVERVVGTAKAYYLRRHQWFFAITIPALGYWSYKGLGKKIDTAKLVIIITIVIAAIPRIVFSSLWMQYDLLLIPLASFIASCFIIEVLEKYLVPHIASTKLQIGLLVYLVILSSSWYQVFKQSNPLEQYLASVDERVNFLVDNLAEDEHVEYFSMPMCLGRGFARQASPLIQKHYISMGAFEKIYGEDRFGKQYIDLLNRKKVKYIIGSAKIYKHLSSVETRKFIIMNYHYSDCLWTRRTPFPSVRIKQ